MNDINKTLYIPLYGKAYVSQRGLIIQDKKAEYIWEKEGFSLKGKSKSKWLAYYMAMRAAVYDEWAQQEIKRDPTAVVLHIGCGMDSRIERVAPDGTHWFDIDFPDVIEERRRYYSETEFYHMLPADMRSPAWKSSIAGDKNAIIILEGVSMYFKPEELTGLLSDLSQHFCRIKLLMDCYTKRAAKASLYKNPVNDVGVRLLYGYDDPRELANASGLHFDGERCMTPQAYINKLTKSEKFIFQRLFAGKFAKSLYRMYEFKKE